MRIETLGLELKRFLFKLTRDILTLIVRLYVHVFLSSASHSWKRKVKIAFNFDASFAIRSFHLHSKHVDFHATLLVLQIYHFITQSSDNEMF